MPLSEYYAQLRRSIGHDVLLIPGVTACVFNSHGAVLCVRHTNNGLWAPPGGAVELDEHPTEALTREIAEELGTDITIDGIIGVYGGPDWRLTYPNHDEVAYVTTAYAATLATTDLTLDTREVTATRYLTRDDIPHLTTPAWAPTVLDDAHDWWRKTTSRSAVDRSADG